MACLLFWCWPYTGGNMVNKTSSRHNRKYEILVTFPCLEEGWRKLEKVLCPNTFLSSFSYFSFSPFSSSSLSCRAPWLPPPLRPPPACTRTLNSSGIQVWKVTCLYRHLRTAALRLDLGRSAQSGTETQHFGQDGEFVGAYIKHCPPFFLSGHSHALSVYCTGSERSPRGTRPHYSPPCRWYTCRSIPGLPWSPSCRRVSIHSIPDHIQSCT